MSARSKKYPKEHRLECPAVIDGRMRVFSFGTDTPVAPCSEWQERALRMFPTALIFGDGPFAVRLPCHRVSVCLFPSGSCRSGISVQRVAELYLQWRLSPGQSSDGGHSGWRCLESDAEREGVMNMANHAHVAAPSPTAPSVDPLPCCLRHRKRRRSFASRERPSTR